MSKKDNNTYLMEGAGIGAGIGATGGAAVGYAGYKDMVGRLDRGAPGTREAFNLKGDRWFKLSPAEKRVARRSLKANLVALGASTLGVLGGTIGAGAGYRMNKGNEKKASSSFFNGFEKQANVFKGFAQALFKGNRPGLKAIGQRRNNVLKAKNALVAKKQKLTNPNKIEAIDQKLKATDNALNRLNRKKDSLKGGARLAKGVAGTAALGGAYALGRSSGQANQQQQLPQMGYGY